MDPGLTTMTGNQNQQNPENRVLLGPNISDTDSASESMSVPEACRWFWFLAWKFWVRMHPAGSVGSGSDGAGLEAEVHAEEPEPEAAQRTSLVPERVST